jgi:hypothetical protein
MLLAAVGMAGLTRLGLHSSYASHVLPPLLLIGTGIGLSMPAAMSQATLGVEPGDQGVASATVNTSQQVGGSISTALLNTLAAAAATGYAVHHPADPLVAANAALHSYATAYWWAAGFFVSGALVTALLFRRHRAGAPPAEPPRTPAAAAPTGAAVVRGRALDGAGAPVPHAVVALLAPGGRRLARASAGADGWYTLAVPSRGSAILIGSAPGHRPQVDTLTVGSAPVRQDVVLLADTGVLVGTVRAPRSGGVSGALVVVTDERGAVAASTTTDVHGGYRMDGLMRGGYTVSVSAPGHRPAAEPVTVSDTETGSRCDLELGPAASLHGTVRSRDGRPLAAARVTLLDAGGDVVAARSTGADGSYRFADLAEERYTVIASGYSPVATPIVLDGSSDDAVDLLLGDEEPDAREGHGFPATPVPRT